MVMNSEPTRRYVLRSYFGAARRRRGQLGEKLGGVSRIRGHHHRREINAPGLVISAID
jgi:hypothetical protein